MNLRSINNRWKIIVIASILIFGTIGFFIGSMVEYRVSHQTIAQIPDVDIIIQCISSEVSDNAAMFSSTIKFAAASGNLEATYWPDYPDEVKITGSGFSSTETPYEFTIYLKYDRIDGRWGVGYWSWEPVKES